MKKKLKDTLTDLRTKLITRDNPRSPISEQYRTIRTNIDFSLVDKELTTLLCTSSVPGEGKSTTIANLAVTYAQQGKRVLLVDADMRLPTAHMRFQKENIIGLTSVLTKRNSLEEAVQTSDVEDLFILTSGPIPPNPSELLSSNSMRAMIAKAEKTFDLILFDAPPVLAVTDAQLLGSLCDGTILVVKSNSTDKAALLKAKGLLDKANVTLLGTILNGVKQDKEMYYYYGK